MPDDIELATLVDVPVLRAGTHHSHNAGEIAITEAELDDIIEASQALAPLVKESYDTGQYRGNEALRLHKMPGLLNFVHDGMLADTIKERTKGVQVEYRKKFFPHPDTGVQVPWITQTFRDVPNDVAEAIQTRFPKRSVELIPFTHPDTGKTYRMAIRSTAFLNNDWQETRPAVSGQDNNFHVEFSQGDDPVIVLSSGDPGTASINMQPQEGERMAKEHNEPKTDEQSMPVTAGIVPELQSQLDATVAELQSFKEMHDAEKAERAKLDEQIAALRAKDEQRDVLEFMRGLRDTYITGADGVVYTPSKAFCDAVEPLIAGTSSGAVIELAGEQKPARQTLMETVIGIIELASKNGGMLVALGQLAPDESTPPDGETPPKSVTELMAEYEKDGLSPSDAWKKANEGHYGGE
jgi:hypothetical protein